MFGQEVSPPPFQTRNKISEAGLALMDRARTHQCTSARPCGQGQVMLGQSRSCAGTCLVPRTAILILCHLSSVQPFSERLVFDINQVEVFSRTLLDSEVAARLKTTMSRNLCDQWFQVLPLISFSSYSDCFVVAHFSVLFCSALKVSSFF